MRFIRKFAILISILTAAETSGVAGETEPTSPLKPPFDVAARRAVVGHSGKPVVCPTPPPPVRDLRGTSFYKDKKGTIDPEKFELAKQLEAPSRNYTVTLTQLGELYIGRMPRDKQLQDCLFHWLASWANACALCGEMDNASEAYRMWALTPIATAFLIVTGDGEFERSWSEIESIKSWMLFLSDKVRVWLDKSHIKNNLAYWSGSGFALIGIATQNRELFDLATTIGRRGVMEITPGGFLPREVARGHRAFAYHQFALMPLAIIANAAAHNGLNLFEINDKGLCRLAAHLFSSAENPVDFEIAANAQQEVPLASPHNRFSWAEIMLNYCQLPELASYLALARPIKYFRAGGNQTLLYGAEAR